MQFHDRERPRLMNDRPAWAQAPRVALPDICISPGEGDPLEGDDNFNVDLMINGHWVGKTLPAEQIPWLLRDWKKDPEGALRDWFQTEPPQRGQTYNDGQEAGPPTAVATSKSIEDLGL